MKILLSILPIFIGLSACNEKSSNAESDSKARSDALIWASPVFPEIETYINNYTLSPTRGSTTTLNLHQWDSARGVSGVSYTSKCGNVGQIIYTLKLTYKGTQGGNDHYMASISQTLDSETQTIEESIVYQGKDIELFKDQDWRIGVRPHTNN